MQFAFVRHAHPDRSVAPRAKAPLTARGVEAARAAGAFLRAAGVQPDAVCTTGTARTRQTAALLIELLGMPGLQPLNVGGGFRRGGRTLDDKLHEWTTRLGREPGALVFVGHHPSQQYCLSELPDPPEIASEARACVLLYERVDGSWSLVAHYPGLL